MTMCGRYTITSKKELLESRFEAEFEENFTPRYNAAPSQNLPVILNTNEEKIKMMHWGLMPTWVKEILHKSELINVRAETLKAKKSFWKDLQERRCLVLADGFYEWKKMPDGSKVPYHITLKNGQPFALAGIWEVNEDAKGQPISTFAIITTEPNPLMEKIHNRMPVILEDSGTGQWLQNPETDLLRPYPASAMEAYPVSRLVNRTSNDSPVLVKPAG